MTFYVYPIPEHVVSGKVVIPRYVRDSRATVCLDKDGNGKVYSGDKCAFRALAMSRQLRRHQHQPTLLQIFETQENSGFRGVKLSVLESMNTFFEVNMLVFTLQSNNSTSITTCEMKSGGDYEENLYLHVQGNFFCWIKDIDLYCKSYRCETFDTMFTTAKALRRHFFSCSDETWYKYPAGEFKRTSNIFDRLNVVGIQVDEP